MSIKNLFSQHFLDNRLISLPEWSEDYQSLFEQIRVLWAKAQQFGGTWNEAQTEDEFVKPILKLLGWETIVQTKSRHGGQVTRPDYSLFADETIKMEAMPHQGNDDAFYSRVLAVGEAKYWGRPLSSKQSDGRDDWKTGANPSHQMVSYLVGTRCPWGILTNGMTWRLYSREVSSTASQFYEIDLSSLFDFLPKGITPSEIQIDHFKRWWLFFRKSSFLPDSSGKSFVKRVLEGSDTYAREVSDKLKELVFEEVMPEIAGGYIAYRYHEKNITEETPESLTEIYRASLSLLYKLLFLLYAEARFLLPMEQETYRRESLTDMAQQIARKVDERHTISTSTYATPNYDRLLALFHRIDRGDSSLNIPRYNGGLFSLKNLESQFIESHKLSDQSVTRAVDILVRDAGQPVDYAFISVRNLGSIYEGLLENKLHVIDAELGKVELINDKGERKSTGSYYTPDYIVKYIVENTLTPILDEREKEFQTAMQSVASLRNKLAKTADASTNRLLRSELETAERQAQEAFLGIKVLDPAMGSGHFPVNAVDFLTDAIIRRMQIFHDTHEKISWEWNPIQALIERVRNEVLNEMQSQNIHVESKRLDDTALLTRLVMKHCIYGVDLNPMAVELAKLSLWLHSFTVGAPLSFLDHHLRWGNSLIGTDVRATEKSLSEKKQQRKVSKRAKKLAEGRKETPGETITNIQTSLFGGPFAGLLDLTSIMTEIVERADATLADVKKSAEDFESFQKALIPYKQILNLWVSQYFGNTGAVEVLEHLGENILPAMRGEYPIDEKYSETLNNARQLWQEKRFFHWDLEFPEVFVDLKKRNWAKNSGFDAIIGNPPYVNIERIDKQAIPFWLEKFVAADRRFDLYILFYEQAIQLLRKNGMLGFITPESFLSLPNGEKLRKVLLERCKIKVILDLTKVNVFSDAINSVIVVIAEGDLPNAKHEFKIVPISIAGNLERSPEQGFTSSYEIVKQHPHQLIKLNLSWDVFKVIQKIFNKSFLMKDMFYVSYGAQPVPLNAFLADNPVDARFKPMVKGESVTRYEVDWQGLYLKYVPNELHRPAFPELFERNNILVGRVTGEKGLQSVASAEKYYTDKTVNICVPLYELQNIDSETRKQRGIEITDNDKYRDYANHYIMALLNSRLMHMVLRQWISGQIDVFPENLRDIPIRHIEFTTLKNERMQLNKEAKYLITKIEGIGNFPGLKFPDFLATPLGRWLDTRLNTKAEQSDVVHDLLAELAKKMVDLSKQRQIETKGFLVWLEREIGAKIDELTGKTSIQHYVGDYVKREAHLPLDGLLDVLRRNARKIKVDLSSRSFQERLEKEYMASLEKLLPIKYRLMDIDRLIDLIIYRLYGLTEEEVNTIEGKK